MIQEFSVENILSIKTRQTISFELPQNKNYSSEHFVNIGGKKLLKIIALYGSNAAGKSNMLNAFDNCFRFMMYGFTNLKPSDNTGFEPFLFDLEAANKPGLFEIVFFINDVKYEYLLTYDSNCIHKESLFYGPKGQKKLIFERICENLGNERELLSYKYKWGDVFSGAKNKIASMTRPNVTFFNTAAHLHHPLIQDIYNWLEKTYLPIIFPSHQNLLMWTIEQIEKNQKMKKDVISYMSHAGFNHIDDIIINNEEIPPTFLERIPENERAFFKNSDGKFIVKEIFISHNYKNVYPLPIYDESSGTQRMLELAGPLLTVLYNKKFLCIDEIEASLHADLQEFLIKTFINNSFGSQIIFTTHNQALMDSGLLLDDSIWFVEKGDDGGSSYKCSSQEQGMRKATSRMKMYKDGKFGAKPKITEYIVNKEDLE